MLYPAMTELSKMVDSRYSLVIATSKRAREIEKGDNVLVKCDSKNSVTQAVNEIYEGKVKIVNAEEADIHENDENIVNNEINTEEKSDDEEFEIVE